MNNRRVRRKPGTLVPLEVAILAAAQDLTRRGEPDFYGLALASKLKNGEEARRLLSHGTLYRALDRLRREGLLSSYWEPVDPADPDRRPRRRMYRITAAGGRALATAQASTRAPIR